MASNKFIISAPAIIDYEIKKSRFIAEIMPCSSEQDALRKLGQLAQQHPNANHLAFAWRIRQPEGFITERMHDAGEPSGTAGKPILAPLQGASLINTVIGVIRYFGGIKLGTGGLTRAYGQAAKMAIEAADLVLWVEMTELTLDIDYNQLQLLEYQLNKIDGHIIDQQFTDKVKVKITLPVTKSEQIKQQFSGF